MQVVARGRDREDAIQRLSGFLKQTQVQGIHTNIPSWVAILG